MHRVKALSRTLLVICLILGTILMSSCNMLYFITGGLIPPRQQNNGDTNSGTVAGDIYVNGGDTNNITINSSAGADTLAASKAILSVVSIAAEFEKTSLSLLRPTTEPFYQYGSGVIYKLNKEKGEAYIITNYHVIYSSSDNSQSKIARNISLFLYGMEFKDYAIKAEFVGGSMTYDLAVLKVSASPIIISSLATAATVADSNNVSILEPAIAIGNPNADGISATLGYVSVDSETISLLAADDLTQIDIRVMRIDTAINSGNSGGGLFNNKGELIGIVNAKRNFSDGMGYAIPSNVAKYVADNIIYYCDGRPETQVQRMRLDVTVTANNAYVVYDNESGKILKKETVVVSVLPNTSAVKDILAVGDIITSMKIGEVEYNVSRTFHVVDAMINAKVGDTVEFRIIRDGKDKVVSITLTEALISKVQ